MATQPAGGAVLHLLCDLPPELDRVITPWWDQHLRELLTLDGFLSARRALRAGAGVEGRILAVYRLTHAAAADQPRPESFARLPPELDGRVVFNRRVLHRVDDAPADEPVGRAILQLLRRPPHRMSLLQTADRVRGWPGVLSVSAWSNGAADDFHQRADVVQVSDSELILVELDTDPADLAARAAAELPEWSAAAYEQSVPARGRVLLPERPERTRAGQPFG